MREVSLLGRGENLAMRFIKKSSRKSPRVSLVLLDWSVRESFHLLHYLGEQTVARDDFEVIVIEYYSRVSEAIKKFENMVDTWLVLDMPANCCYQKHLMYNAGIIVANGDIVSIGDSDAMVKPSFIETIIKAFEKDPKVVYHIDQFRNLRRDFYPFNYPSFEDVLGEGCVNNIGGKTAGVLDSKDPIHSRNYGGCMCAKRDDLIAIGGADMHINYMGLICGPYDMTFRLINYGLREVWDTKEFTYHTWHPVDGDNYVGPHDGRHMSTMALEALASGRIAPLSENEAIHPLRTGAAHSSTEVLDKLIPINVKRDWDLKNIEANGTHLRFKSYKTPLGAYKGFRIVSESGRVLAYPMVEPRSQLENGAQNPVFEGATEDVVKAKITKATPTTLAIIDRVTPWYVFPFCALSSFYGLSQRLPFPLPRPAKALLGLIVIPFAFFALVGFAPMQLIDKLRRMKRDSISTAEGLGHIAAIITNRMKWGISNVGNELPVVLTDRRMAIYFFRLLQFFSLMPRIMIRRVVDVDTVQSVLSDLDGQGWSGQLLVPAELFSRFNAFIRPAAAAQHLIVT